MIVEREFISIGVNRVVNSLDWGDGGRIAYGGHDSVIIYDPDKAEVESTLVGHTGRVNAVLWVDLPVSRQPSEVPSRLLLSGSADNTVRVWALQADSTPMAAASRPTPEGKDPIPWRCIAVLEGHTAPVNALACYPLNISEDVHQGGRASSSGEAAPFLVVSTAGDAYVHVWCATPRYESTATVSGEHVKTPCISPSALASIEAAYGQTSWELHQRLEVGTHIQQAAALTHLPIAPSWLLLATGGTDKLVRLHVRAPGRESRFVEVCRLTGHENWIRSLAFCHANVDKVSGSSSSGADVPSPHREVELLLASASQDRYGRIWRIRDEDLQAAEEAAAASAAAIRLEGALGLTASIAKYAPKPRFTAGGHRLLASLEALLIGHEDWLHTITWRPTTSSRGGADSSQGASTPSAGHDVTGRDVPRDRQDLSLLTSSMDRTMMLWRHDPASGIWMSSASIGDAGAQCLGYFGGSFSPDGTSIVAHGFTGALHLWDQRQEGTPHGAGSSSSSSSSGSWVPRHAQGGHFAPVASCCWSMDGGCLLTVGEDQTARIFTQVKSSSGSGGVGGGSGEGHWCELARPQVHGHDFTCVASIPSGSSNREASSSSPFVFISGSEEKMLRVFEAPQVFLDTLDMARGRVVTKGGNQKQRAFGAAIPALGLSNKAVYEGDTSADGGANAGVSSGMSSGGYHEGPDLAPCAVPSVASGPPLEEHLAQNTLWPEVHKLYGHGNDVYCLAATHDGRYAASACIAKSTAAAEIWFWAVGSWKGVAQVQAHTLTVTALAWSNNDDFLASCSRDRSLCITRRIKSADPGMEDTFQLVQRIKSAHARVVWGVHWSPDDRLVASGSRDGTVKLWNVTTAGKSQEAGSGAGVEGAPVLLDRPAATLPIFGSAVCSLAFAPLMNGPTDGEDATVVNRRYMLAVGLEDGNLQLWSSDYSSGALAMKLSWSSNDFTRHSAAISSLCWRVKATPPQESPSGSAILQVASAGRDHSVRVFSVLFDCDTGPSLPK